MVFEWSGRKSFENLRKHGLEFEEAATAFRDPLAITFMDPDHSIEEHRELTIGCTIKDKVVFVSHYERSGRMRIISARPATRSERAQYEEGIGI